MSRILSYARAILLLPALPLFTLFCSFVSLFILAPFASRKTCDGFIRFWARTMAGMAGIRIHVSGLENLKGIKAAILVSNHLSHFDIPVLFAAIPLSFRMVAKVELFRIPVFGPALKALGFVPVVREGGGENAKTSIQYIQERFKEGGSIWIAPEGTRQNKPRIGNFKMGAFYFALKVQRAVVPICIYGTQKVLPKKSWLVSWGHWRPQVWVNVLPPVIPDQPGADSRHALRDNVRDLMIKEFSKFTGETVSSCVDRPAE